MVKVFAAVAAPGVVPPGAVTVTTLSPVGVPAEIITVTVAVVPSVLTAGGLATVMPVGGMKSMLLAEFRFLPDRVRVKLLFTSRRIGWMLRISGAGRVTRNVFAPGTAGSAVIPPSMTVRLVTGALWSISITTCA